MSSPTIPTHGKYGAIYRLRPNGFKGDGLNDAVWGSGFSGASSAYFEVMIDAEGTPDTFKWRKDGGEWTTGVAITGAAQTLSDGQTITFGATTGHTLNDQWVIGNLKDEACSESGETAQITASAKQILNPNNPPTFTDDGGESVLITNYTEGKATFTANVGAVTVTGNNGYIVKSCLEKIGYLINWSFVANLDLAELAYMGQEWKSYLPGQAGGSGSAEGYFIGCDTLFENIKDNIDGSQDYFFLELYSYDPDQDQTGDHFNVWVTFNGWNINAPIGEIIKEGIDFTLHNIPSFIANI